MEKPNKYLLPALFCSGGAALIYQIAWMRPIGLVYNSSIYLVAIVTTAFMLGLAVGGYYMRLDNLVDRLKRPALIYALIEAGIALYALILLELFTLLPGFNEKLQGINNPNQYHSALFISIIVLLIIPTSLMGATFPLAAKIWAQAHPARGIGEIYSVNNLGAIIGALFAGFILIPQLGVRGTVFLAVGLNLFAAALVLFSGYGLQFWKQTILTGTLVIVLGAASSYSIDHLYRSGMYGFGGKDYLGEANVVFEADGLISTVTVMEVPSPEGPIQRLFIDGQGSSSLRMSDMRVSVLLGYLPRWLNPELDNAAVIGFGVGGAARMLANGVETTSIEIEPEVINAAPFFQQLNNQVLQDPRHHLIYDDARNHLLRTKETYGIIVNHPLDPNRAFSSLLFTQEFFNIVKSRLKPGGFYVQWFPLYNMSKKDFSDLYATLSSVFPYQIAFANTPLMRELIFICSDQKIPFNPQELEAHFQQQTSEDQRLLQLTKMDSNPLLIDLKVVTEADLGPYRKMGSILTDDQPRLEFTAALNMIIANRGDLIISELGNIRMNNLIKARQ